MHVETAICTWNRASLLDQMLAEFRLLEIPHGVKWEVMVVNNHCSDSTDEVIARHAAHLPIRRLFEPRPGLSHARNCAVAAARGDLLTWTDDDVSVDRHWLAHYVKAAKQDPASSFFGGPIEPWFEVQPPAWLTAMLSVPGIEGAFALRTPADRAVRLDRRNPHDLPYGANFAIRTDVQRAYRYDPRLGRNKDRMISGEESGLLARMIADGHHGRWVPGARVLHFIPKERFTRDFLRRFFVGLGRTNWRMNIRHGPNSRPGLWIQAFYAEFMYRWYRLTKNHRRCAMHLIHGCQIWGQLAERLSEARLDPT